MRSGLLFGLAAALVLGRAAAAAPGEVAVAQVYEGRLLVKVLDVRVDDVAGPAIYRTGARIKGSAAVSRIKPFTLLVQSNGRMVAGAPGALRYTHQEGRKRRTVRFAGSPARRTPADPLTQILRIMLTPAAASPCIGTLAAYDGKQRYDLTFTPAGKGELSARQRSLGLSGPLRCNLGFRPVAGFKGSRKGPGLTGASSATFARSAAGDVWVMTDLSIGTIIGPARLSLTDLSVRGRRAGALR